MEHGYVATMNAPVASGLHEQSLAEVEFFKEEGLEDLLQNRMATSNVLVERISDMYVKYLSHEWVPKTIKLLCKKSIALAQRDRDLGLPRAHMEISGEVRVRVVQACSAAIAETKKTLLSKVIAKILVPLKHSLMDAMEKASQSWSPILDYDKSSAELVSAMGDLIKTAADDIAQSMSTQWGRG